MKKKDLQHLQRKHCRFIKSNLNLAVEYSAHICRKGHLMITFMVLNPLLAALISAGDVSAPASAMFRRTHFHSKVKKKNSCVFLSKTKISYFHPHVFSLTHTDALITARSLKAADKTCEDRFFSALI